MPPSEARMPRVLISLIVVDGPEPSISGEA